MTNGPRFVDVPGGRLWWEAAGSGSGVVLIHAGVSDSRMWDPQWEALAARHRAVRYDTRGYGRTETEHVPFSTRADVIAAMDAAGLARATLVGGSRGGSIALDTTLESPDRVSGVVWVCGGVGGLNAEPTPEERAIYDRGDLLYEARDWRGLADLDVAVWVDGVGQPAGRAPEAARELVGRTIYETYAQEKEEGEPIVLDPPAAGRLEEIGVPVLVIAGALDTSGTAAGADALMASVRDARRIDLPDVAHVPSLEKPEWFTGTLLEFLGTIGR